MKISQAEARRLKRRVRELEEMEKRRKNRWVTDYPGGVNLGYIDRSRDWLAGRIEAARMLGHAIVVTEEEGRINFFACKL